MGENEIKDYSNYYDMEEPMYRDMTRTISFLDPDFALIAAATGGVIYDVPKASIASEIPAIVNSAAAQSLSSLLNSEESYLSGSTNTETFTNLHNGVTHMTITVLGNDPTLSCTDINGDEILEFENILDIGTSKIAKYARASASGDPHFTNAMTCTTSSSSSYTIRSTTGYSGCEDGYCLNSGTCIEHDECGLFTCDCGAAFNGTLCEIVL